MRNSIAKSGATNHQILYLNSYTVQSQIRMHTIKIITNFFSILGLSITGIFFMYALFNKPAIADTLYGLCVMLYFSAPLFFLRITQNTRHDKLFTWVAFTLSLLPLILLGVAFYEMSGIEC